MENDQREKNKIKPMGFGPSVLYFGIPSAIAAFGVYYVMQRLYQNGVDNFVNFYLSMIVPLALMLIAALIAFKMEGNRLDWKTLSVRFRLKKMTKTDWTYTFLLLAVQILLYGGLSFTAKWLIQFDLFAPPEFLLPAVDPRIDQGIFLDTFMGVTLKGQWWIAIIYFIALLFNIFGEEFWWRGYILPRQELVFKKWTWVVHGTLWGLFHIFWKWNLIILIPSCLVFSYVIYKRKNTTIGIISHMAFNSIPLIGIILGIIG
jgi:membrane protease YdiL (CAAX protease family)